MCDGGGDSNAARRFEKQRQADIDAGMLAIDQSFNPGWRGGEKATAYTPGTTYYNAQGNPWAISPTDTAYKAWVASQPKVAATAVPTGSRLTGRGQTGTPPISAATTVDDYMKYLAQQGKLYSTRNYSEGFDPLYAQARQNYLARQGFNADGTLDRNTAYGQELAARQLGLLGSFGGRGLLRSSAFNNANTALQRADTSARSTIASGAEGFVNDFRNDVNNQRTSLVNQLLSSANPNLAAQEAARVSSSITLPTVTAPLSGLLNDWASIYLTSQMAKNNQAMAANPFGNYNFGMGGSGVKTTRTIN